jgi:hypothetical protein
MGEFGATEGKLSLEIRVILRFVEPPRSQRRHLTAAALLPPVLDFFVQYP